MPRKIQHRVYKFKSTATAKTAGEIMKLYGVQHNWHGEEISLSESTSNNGGFDLFARLYDGEPVHVSV
jgi:hypothetical protein